MMVFFEKAKKLAPALLTTISPSAASAVFSAPPSVVKDPVPPSTSGEEAAAPLLPRSIMLRWRRLSFFVAVLVFSF
jgi:hypothetical protein